MRDFPIPAFAAFLAFELHEAPNGSFFVKILYNPGIPRAEVLIHVIDCNCTVIWSV